MILADVNILLYAHRRDAPQHERFRDWLAALMASPSAYGVSDLVSSSVVRIATDPRIYEFPSTKGEALSFLDDLRGRPNCRLVRPGARHWEIFTRLCRESGVRGGDVSDAYLAALAIENGCEWVTTDRAFKRFRGLKYRRPF